MRRRQKTNFWVYLAGVVILVVIIVLVATRAGRAPAPAPAPVVDTQVRELQTQSTSDEVGEIGSDLNNTNLDQIDSELREVEQTLPAL